MQVPPESRAQMFSLILDLLLLNWHPVVKSEYFMGKPAPFFIVLGSGAQKWPAAGNIPSAYRGGFLCWTMTEMCWWRNRGGCFCCFLCYSVWQFMSSFWWVFGSSHTWHHLSEQQGQDINLLLSQALIWQRCPGQGSWSWPVIES